MSLIDDRYRCSDCDGYVGYQFRNLGSYCRCGEPPKQPEPKADAPTKSAAR